MQPYLIDILVCPACHGELEWAIHQEAAGHIETADVTCSSCEAPYSVREGIGAFLMAELAREDFWAEIESAFTRHLREHPQIEVQLLSTPLEQLNPADQFYCAMALESKGDFRRSEEAERLSLLGCYSPEYLDCWERQAAYLLTRLDMTSGPIVDLASGRCTLVKRMLPRSDRPIIASDFSLSVMRRNRAWLKATGQDHRVSLLVFDARKSPLRSSSVSALTTNLGLPNIRGPHGLHNEIRRILSGEFLAISHFYLPGDGNAQVIEQAGLAAHLYRDPALRVMENAGLRVRCLNTCHGHASPTPTGQVIDGAGIDGLPVEDAELEWCVLEAT